MVSFWNLCVFQPFGHKTKKLVGCGTSVASIEIFGNPSKGENTGEYTHGQYADSKTTGTFGTAVEDDDHHSPLNPDMYIKLRVEPQARFYQKRLPRYYRMRTFVEAVLLLGSLSGMAMASLGVRTVCVSEATFCFTCAIL